LIYVLIWWLVMQFIGALALPVSMRLFRWLPDRGYAFSKALGLLLSSYFLWVGASLGLLQNDTGGILFSLLLVAGLSAWSLWRGQGWSDLKHFLRTNRRLVIGVELLFLLAFVLWTVLRAYAAYKIEPAGGEKFMEIAFLNAILRSPQFPPHDPWLSGFAISYYYFGYVMMALLTRLSGVPATIGFELYDALLFALTAIGAFGVAYNLVASRSKPAPGEDPPPSHPLWPGFLGAFLVTLIGNLEGMWEALHARGLFSLQFWQWLGIPGLAEASTTGSWYPGSLWSWWWRASRVIQDVDLLGRPLGVSPIDEFPFFSFLLGDNHPHVLALPFVLMTIGLALNVLLRALRLPVEEEESAPLRFSAAGLRQVFGGDWLFFLLSALLLGALGFLNTWDMPIYLALVMLAYGLGAALRQGQLSWQIVLRTFVFGAGLGLFAVLLYFFFYISFGSQAGGILPHILPPTSLPQYLTMFGVFIYLIAFFLAAHLHHHPEQRAAWKAALVWWLRVLGLCLGFFVLVLILLAVSDYGRQLAQGQLQDPGLLSVLGGLGFSQALKAILSARLRDPWTLLLVTALLGMALGNLSTALKPAKSEPPASEVQEAILPGSLFAFLLIFTGLALTLSVEFVYLRDSFGVRMNTVFKFYYQAWVMLALAGAYAFWWLVAHLRKPAVRWAFLAGAVLLFALGLLYPLMASWGRVEGFATQPSLDGASSLARGNPDDWAAIAWLNTNVEGAPVILEAPSSTLTDAGSYRYEGRISAFTGLPAVLGWSLHESQWRGNFVEQALREPDIAAIYSTKDPQLALDLLKKWGVEYVILGNPEQNFIQQVCEDPARACNLTVALRKFDLFLEPVFSTDSLTIYKVP
jgi:YYY domain-containing protein